MRLTSRVWMEVALTEAYDVIRTTIVVIFPTNKIAWVNKKSKLI